MSDLRAVGLVAIALAGGCGSSPSLPPVEQAIAARPIVSPPTAVDDWADECSLALDTAKTLPWDILFARRDRDVVRLVCIVDKQTQVEALISLMQEHLSRVLATCDEDQLLHELKILQVACRRIDRLRDQAQHCVGEENFRG